MDNLQTKSLSEIIAITHDRYDGNSGEIILGFQEMGLRGEKLRKALIRYIETKPAY